MVCARISMSTWPERAGDPGFCCAQAFYLQQQASAVLGATADQLPGMKLHYYPNLTQNSGESEETKRCGCMPSARHCRTGCEAILSIWRRSAKKQGC